jgi:arylsulfatase A-like enzyme
MSAPNILVVVVDGLRASAPGSYGNTTFPTPAFDRFAAESFLLDWCFAPSPDLADIYRSLWHGVHPARLSPRDPLPSLPKLLTVGGYSTTLLTDDPQLLTVAAADDFDECIQIHDAALDSDAHVRAADIPQTSLARVFAATCDLIAAGRAASRANAPRLIWVHSRGMYGPWDAPLEFQQSLLDEGDPPPVENTTPPDLTLSESEEPDAAFRYASAYAAQAMALDDGWDNVLQSIESAPDEKQWLVTLIGARGFPLGEHRRVGGVDHRLYSEQLHVPWLVRSPDGFGRLSRSGQLVSHTDLLPTLLARLGDNAPQVTSHFDGFSVLPLATTIHAPWRDVLIATSATDARAMRTADWCLRKDASSAADAELYVRPDDRFEINNVAKLCPDVVESLSKQLDETMGQLGRLEPAAPAKHESR